MQQPEHDSPAALTGTGLFLELWPSLATGNKPHSKLSVGWPQIVKIPLFWIIYPLFWTSPIHVFNLGHLLRDTLLLCVQTFHLQTFLPFLSLLSHSLPPAPSRQSPGLASPLQPHIQTFSALPLSLLPSCHYSCLLSVKLWFKSMSINLSVFENSVRIYFKGYFNYLRSKCPENTGVKLFHLLSCTPIWTDWRGKSVGQFLNCPWCCSGHNGNSGDIFGKDPPCLDTITPWPSYTLT